MVIVLEKIKPQNFWKSHGNVLYSYVNLHSLIKRINIYKNIYSFNQTIVSHLCHVSYTHVYIEISHNVWSWKFGIKSWKGHGHLLVNMCMNPGDRSPLLFIFHHFFCVDVFSFIN